MDQEIDEWTPFGSSINALPENYVQNLLTEANVMLDDDAAFDAAQPITQLLKLVVRANNDMGNQKMLALEGRQEGSAIRFGSREICIREQIRSRHRVETGTGQTMCFGDVERTYFRMPHTPRRSRNVYWYFVRRGDRKA